MASPGPPRSEPIGLYVARVAKALNRAFEAALADAGGSLPTWLILLSLKSGRWGTQRELAEAIGIRGATLTHHLDGLERGGLVSRRRDPSNRRVQVVELAAAGEELFERLREAALAFDARLRDGIGERDLERLRQLLGRLGANVEG
jgi:MarR family transcriptional regulator, transcriptional regulator for hemolysin